MPGKSVPLSVRLTPEEASFLAGYEAPNSRTLSEKVRAIIAEAKEQQTGNVDYASSLAFTTRLLSPALACLREAEDREKAHSELLAILMHWLPEVTALLLAHTNRTDGSIDNLETLEADVADRTFSLFEQILRLGVTGESPCYDPMAIIRRVNTIVKLSEIVNHSTKTTEE